MCSLRRQLPASTGPVAERLCTRIATPRDVGSISTLVPLRTPTQKKMRMILSKRAQPPMPCELRRQRSLKWEGNRERRIKLMTATEIESCAYPSNYQAPQADIGERVPSARRLKLRRWRLKDRIAPGRRQHIAPPVPLVPAQEHRVILRRRRRRRVVNAVPAVRPCGHSRVLVTTAQTATHSHPPHT